MHENRVKYFRIPLGFDCVKNITTKKDKNTMDYREYLWSESWTRTKTAVDIVGEPFLILDKNLCVMSANKSFYRTFQVKEEDTENKLIYNLGDGQWNIPVLKKLLEDILPKNTFFKGFEVVHDFPIIGRKVMLLNARQVFITHDKKRSNPQIILLAIEDVTDIMEVADMLAQHTSNFQTNINDY